MFYSRRPTMYLMVGLPGAGKTTIAKQLETRHQALRFTPDEWIIPLFGGARADDQRWVLEGRLIWVTLRALEIGVNVVMDFGLWGKDERYALRALGKSVGADCNVVYLPVDLETQKQRVTQRFLTTPGETFPMTFEELKQWQRQFEAPDEDELTGDADVAPPDGFATWSAWAANHWPSLRTK